MKRAARTTSAAVFGAALLTALAGCGADGGGPAEAPDGFTDESAEGISYALPSDFDEDRAQVDVMLAGDEVDSAAAVGGTAQAEIKFEPKFEYLDKDWDYEVAGVPDSERYDYTYEFDGDEDIDTIRGVDIAMKLEDGRGVLFRLTGDHTYLDDELVDQITGTVHSPED
ncbi:hypothetical protein HNR23_000698 [Nocardiopsis mwathae]|uniref:Lipoprotein n=1 Tax=Nocardiopsis mwathae TaxID=1472723 RepID=A0A7W9YEE8_9ACTN|nr:hypothetical protein [Nocardiopsis mwathae]MBB6170638.1 hypothetical protein [Nocardiopsis mwathae]